MSAVTAVKPKDVYQINDLNLWYGEHHALKNINLTIPEYEITAIIGARRAAESRPSLKR
jgi:phosphate transport system ATP-binding protein